jgi:RNA polymerase sigma-70 factor (ECF subfamily)
LPTSPRSSAVRQRRAVSWRRPARRRISTARVDPAQTIELRTIARDFKRAWEAGDIPALVSLLDPDAIAIADTGGLASAIQLQPFEGAEPIARACVDVMRMRPNLTILEASVNGQPGLIAEEDGVTVTVYAFAIAGGHITHIWAMRNPDKLRAWRS